MNFPRRWVTSTLSLALTGSALGVYWRTLRDSHAHSVNVSGTLHPTPEPQPRHAPLTPEKADALLTALWESCVPWTVNGVLQVEHHPTDSTAAMVDTLTPGDLATLLERGESETDPARRDTLRKLLFESCAVSLPERALAIARGWPAEFADPLIAPMLVAWHRQNPDGAAWFAEIKAKNPGAWKDCQKVLTPAVEGTKTPPPGPAPSSLTQAWEETSKLAESREQGSWHSSDIQPLAAWAGETGQWDQAWQKLSALPEHKQEQARNSFLAEWTKKDWRSWMEWEQAHPERRSPKEIRRTGGFLRGLDECVTGMNGAISMEDIDRAEISSFLDESFKALSSMSTSANADFSWLNLIGSWAEFDSTSASAWLDRQPAGPLRDKAARTVAETVSVEEPEAAFAWADSIKDAALRDATLVSCWQKWRALEPGPADAWVDGHFPEVRSLAAKADASKSGQ